MVKKKLSPCKEAQNALAACRQLIEPCHREREQLRVQLEDTKAQLMQKNDRVEELERALGELKPLAWGAETPSPTLTTRS